MWHSHLSSIVINDTHRQNSHFLEWFNMNLKLQFCHLDVCWFEHFEDLKVLEESEKMSKASDLLSGYIRLGYLIFSNFFCTKLDDSTRTPRQNVLQRSRKCRRRFRCRTSRLRSKFLKSFFSLRNREVQLEAKQVFMVSNLRQKTDATWISSDKWVPGCQSRSSRTREESQEVGRDWKATSVLQSQKIDGVSER